MLWETSISHCIQCIFCPEVIESPSYVNEDPKSEFLPQGAQYTKQLLFFTLCDIRVIHSYVVNDKIDTLLLFRPDSEFLENDVWINAIFF